MVMSDIIFSWNHRTIPHKFSLVWHSDCRRKDL